jgi:carboxyl-terminal processing protease
MIKRLIRPVLLLAISIITVESVSAQKDKVQENTDLVFHNTAKMLQAIHFSPQAWTDSFSYKIFTSYLDELDPGKRFFLDQDVTTLAPYEFQLDDELKGKEISFYKKVNELYVERLKETSKLIDDILKQPFTFNGNDSYSPPKNVPYATSAAEQKNRWTNYLKYQVLNQYEEWLQQRLKDSTIEKDDSKLEARARTNVARVEKRVIDNLLKLTTDEEAFNLYVNNIINLYDPHSGYFLPVDRREFQESLSGIYYGIGALLQEQTGKVSIKELMIGGPAWKSGTVESGDVIVKVKQEGSDTAVNVEGSAMSDVVKLTRGSKGTFVTITFRKADGTLKDVTLKRDALQLEDTFVKSAVIGNDNDKIGYISFPKFYTAFDENGRSSAADMAKEIANLKKENVKGIVVDIRNNGGGSLGEVINMVGLFVKNGPVVQVKSSRSKPEVNGVQNPTVAWDGPLVVLVNELSASASEIFAGAIQDYKRGIIMGSSSTYGKGTVQRSFGVPLNLQKYPDTTNDLGTLHVTLQKYYRITGEATQLKGVQSDIVIPGIYEPYKMQEKDQTTALAWDKIESANFNKYEKAAVVEKVINEEASKLADDTTIVALKKDIRWLGARNDNYSLNLKQFTAQKKELRDHMAQIRNRINAPQKINILNINSVQQALPTQEQFRQESNKAWLNSLKNDLYLSKAIGVMKDYITAG